MLLKIYYKNKILICGIFPMVNFNIDGYTQKTGKYDENIINADNDDFIFYSGGYLIHASYSCKEKKGTFFEYFENDELFEYEVPDDLIDNKYEIQKLMLLETEKKIRFLEKKLRLLTGFGISLPIYKTTLYDSDKKLYTYVGNINWQITNLTVDDYTLKMKRLLSERLNSTLSDSTLQELEENNVRFKRALSFYNDSFVSFDIGVRFILLFSTLEALFNLDGEDITNSVSKYTSKILFLPKNKAKSAKWKIITYYKARSDYIHGNECIDIDEEKEQNLREYVREVLLIYWNISTVYGIIDASEIKDLLDKTDTNNLALQVQLFIKYLRTAPKDYRQLYKKIRTNFLNQNYDILTNKNL